MPEFTLLTQSEIEFFVWGFKAFLVVAGLTWVVWTMLYFSAGGRRRR